VTSGNNCKVNGKLLHAGKLGAEVSPEQGKQDARQCILNILGNLQSEISDLNKIKQIVKILGFVASADGFYDQPGVLDAASELLIDIFGPEAGRCARSAIGVNVLPNNQPVEIEMIFEVE
jgi:enamine deaminase RidA (YjgF/YER057c/UK114 family)